MLSFSSYSTLLLILLIPLWFFLKKMGILTSHSFPLLFSEDTKKFFEGNTKSFKFFSDVSSILFCLAFIFAVIALVSAAGAMIGVKLWKPKKKVESNKESEII